MKPSKLNLFALTMIVVSLVIGMGIFRTPVNVAREAGSVTLFFLVWIIGGLSALCGALTYAEIGSRYPATGGYYKIFSYCYHPSVAFAINCIILIGNASSLAGVTLIGSEYLTNVAFKNSGSPDAVKLTVSTITILIFYGVNLLGLKASARTQNILTVIKIGMILLLISALFTGDYTEANIAADTVAGYGGWGSSLKALGICLVAVSFTYGGYQQTINFGGEVENAPKIMPRGIFIGIAIIMLLYLLMNFAYYKVIGFENLKSAESVAALLAGAVFGESGFAVFSILLFLSVLAYVNVMLMSNPRVMYAMSDEGILPSLFKRMSSKTNVLVISLTTFAVVCLMMLFYAKTFDEILNYIIFLDSIGMATSAATIFILRKRTAHLTAEKIYKIKLYPLVPLLFIASYLLAGISIAINTPKAAVVSTIVFAVFFFLFFVLKNMRSKNAEINGRSYE